MSNLLNIKQELETSHLKISNIFGIIETLVLESDTMNGNKKTVLKIIEQIGTLIEFGEQEALALEESIRKLKTSY